MKFPTRVKNDTSFKPDSVLTAFFWFSYTIIPQTTLTS